MRIEIFLRKVHIERGGHAQCLEKRRDSFGIIPKTTVAHTHIIQGVHDFRNVVHFFGQRKGAAEIGESIFIFAHALERHTHTVKTRLHTFFVCR